MIYRRRASPLHATRAAVGCAYCGALALASLWSDDPLLLGAVLAAVVAAGLLAGVGPQLGAAAGFGVPPAPLVDLGKKTGYRDGITVT
ncbi:MAG: hypothetical protein ACR2NH_04985, partial [Solirubrobacteraceae bacterium]